jgi:hypothetical protein
MNNQCYLTSVIRIQAMLTCCMQMCHGSAQACTDQPGRSPLIMASRYFICLCLAAWYRACTLADGSARISPAGITESSAFFVGIICADFFETCLHDSTYTTCYTVSKSLGPMGTPHFHTWLYYSRMVSSVDSQTMHVSRNRAGF